MANSTARLTNDALAFLTERHLAMLTTLRVDNSPHVVAVGFTFDPKTHIARVITTGGSQKAVNAERGGVAVLSQVDGARWLSLEGRASVNREIDAVREAELRYAQPSIFEKSLMLGPSLRTSCPVRKWMGPGVPPRVSSSAPKCRVNFSCSLSDSF
jgi:F420H(2)-dependent biliverdin reductase